jgi:hypothetical protein
MINIFAERRSEVALSEDEHPVQKLGPCRFDPALGDGVRSGRPDRSLDDFDSVCSKVWGTETRSCVMRPRNARLSGHRVALVDGRVNWKRIRWPARRVQES